MAEMTHDELVARADHIGKQAALEVVEAEKAGCFSLALRDLVHESQIHLLLRPKRYGGFGMGPRTFSEVVRTVATYNASAAWLTYFTALHEQWVAFLPPAGRKEIHDTDGFVADIFFPCGQIEYVDGGVIMSGEWKFGSGVLWDEWIGLGAIVEVQGYEADGPQPSLVTVKTSEIEIVHDWDVFGLRGTGSNGVKVDRIFVPWRRVLPLQAVKNTGLPVGGEYDDDEPIYRIPFMPHFCVGFGAISVGAIQSVGRNLKTRIEQRERMLYGVKEWESPIAQRNLGELLVKIASIEALHERYVQQLEQWNDENTPVTTEEDRNRMSAWRSEICSQASQVGFRAMEMLGGMAAYSGDPMEIAARDLFMISIHLGQIYDDNMLSYGRTQYGLSGHPLF